MVNVHLVHLPPDLQHLAHVQHLVCHQLNKKHSLPAHHFVLSFLDLVAVKVVKAADSIALVAPMVDQPLTDQLLVAPQLCQRLEQVLPTSSASMRTDYL